MALPRLILGTFGGLVVTRTSSSSATLIEIDQICQNAISSFSVLEEPVIVLRALSQGLDVETAKKSLLGWLRLGLKSFGLGEHAQVLVMVLLLLLDNVDRTVLIWEPNGIRLLDIQDLRTSHLRSSCTFLLSRYCTQSSWLLFIITLQRSGSSLQTGGRLRILVLGSKPVHLHHANSAIVFLLLQ